MIDIDKRIDEFKESISKIKSMDKKDLPKSMIKEIESTETRYLVYCKDLSFDKKTCTGIYFIPYSHKKFKAILKRLEKNYSQYGEIEVK